MISSLFLDTGAYCRGFAIPADRYGPEHDADRPRPPSPTREFVGMSDDSDD